MQHVLLICSNIFETFAVISVLSFFFLFFFRELESLIFQSGIQLEELKEWIEQSEQDQLVAPTLSDPPHAVQPCVSLKEAEPQPEVR